MMHPPSDAREVQLYSMIETKGKLLKIHSLSEERMQLGDVPCPLSFYTIVLNQSISTVVEYLADAKRSVPRWRELVHALLVLN